MYILDAEIILQKKENSAPMTLTKALSMLYIGRKLSATRSGLNLINYF